MYECMYVCVWRQTKSLRCIGRPAWWGPAQSTPLQCAYTHKDPNSFMYVCMYVTEVCGVEGQRSAIEGVQHGMARAVSCAGAAVSLATLAILTERKELIYELYVCMAITSHIFLPLETVLRRLSGKSCHLPCGRRVTLTLKKNKNSIFWGARSCSICIFCFQILSSCHI